MSGDVVVASQKAGLPKACIHFNRTLSPKLTQAKKCRSCTRWPALDFHDGLCFSCYGVAKAAAEARLLACPRIFQQQAIIVHTGPAKDVGQRRRDTFSYRG